MLLQWGQHNIFHVGHSLLTSVEIYELLELWCQLVINSSKCKTFSWYSIFLQSEFIQPVFDKVRRLIGSNKVDKAIGILTLSSGHSIFVGSPLQEQPQASHCGYLMHFIAQICTVLFQYNCWSHDLIALVLLKSTLLTVSYSCSKFSVSH